MTRTKRLIALAIALLGVSTPVARSDMLSITTPVPSKAQVYSMAEAMWGLPACGQPEIRVETFAQGSDGLPSSPDGVEDVIAYIWAEDDPSSPVGWSPMDCLIHISDDPVTLQNYCQLVLHEWGHLTLHDHTPHGIMRADAFDPYPPCGGEIKWVTLTYTEKVEKLG